MARSNTKKNIGKAADQAGMLPALGRRVGWMLLAGGWLFLTASLASFSAFDAPSHVAAPRNAETANWCGPAGAALAYHAYLMLGTGVWVIVAGLLGFLVAAAAGRRPDQLGLRAMGVLLMAVVVSGYLALLAPEASVMPEGAGGVLAIAAVGELVGRFDVLGTALVLAMAAGVGAMLAVDELVVVVPHALAGGGRRLWTAMNWPRPALAGIGRGLAEIDYRTMLPSLSMPALPRRRPSYRVAETDLEDIPVRHGGGAPLPPAPEQTEPDDREDEEEPDAERVAEPRPGRPKKKAKKRRSPSASAAEEPAATDEAPTNQALDADSLREKIKKLPISIAAHKKPTTPPAAPQQDLSGYQFPGQDLLSEPESHFDDDVAGIVRQQAEVLERALQTFKINAEVVAIDAGPVITLYDVRLAPGTKVNSINAISSDVARELKAQNIRIVPNTAGKSTVGIEVPNLKKEKVRLRELMALSGRDVFERMRLPMFLGKDASGNPLTADLADMPHMLIAGTTGSGKSVCINSIIMSFLYARRPDELKLVLVDPKMVEMAQFRDIPHLMCPVVTEMSKAAAILEWSVTKMEERYALLAEAGVRDIDGYNGLEWEELRERFDPATEEEEAKIPRKLPRMVFVIDELADLMLTHKEVEGFIVRIAQKARAVGIHLILATQRPQANVVTGLIKSNMPCRVALKVSSGMDSRIVLDAKGAELLLGNGDMLFLSPRTSDIVRAQGTLVDDKEVRRACRFLKNVAKQSFEPQLIQLKAPDGEDGPNEMERDELFDDAVHVVLQTRRGSVSLLQRRLTIGYSRASRLIEQMSDAGIIGEYKGSQARQVQITLEEWEAMKAQMEADLASGYAADQPDDSGDTQREEKKEQSAPRPPLLSALEEDAPFEANQGVADEGEEEDDEEQDEEYEYVDEDEEPR